MTLFEQFAILIIRNRAMLPVIMRNARSTAYAFRRRQAPSDGRRINAYSTIYTWLMRRKGGERKKLPAGVRDNSLISLDFREENGFGPPSVQLGFPSALAWNSFSPVWNSFSPAWNSFRAGWEDRPRTRSRTSCGRQGRRSHRLQHAAVDEVGRTDAVGGLVRAEEDEEVGELLGAGESPDGCVLVGDALQIALPVASLAGCQFFCRLNPVGRLDEAGIDAV